MISKRILRSVATMVCFLAFLSCWSLTTIIGTTEAFQRTSVSVTPTVTTTFTSRRTSEGFASLVNHNPSCAAAAAARSPRLFSSSSIDSATISDSSLPSSLKGIRPNGERKTSETSEQPINYRAQAGLFAVRTKYGVLNPFGVWYGFVAIFFAIPWFASLLSYELFSIVTRDKLDPQRRIPNFFNHIWETILMRLTFTYPQVEGLDRLKGFYEGKPCMFVANHNSWMDITTIFYCLGWRNYKFVAKQELSKVPVLSRAIKLAGHLMVDRNDKRSGLKTLKAAIQYLKEGVPVCTFPEGTRSKTGRMLEFKNGAFKMASKAGVPIVPLTIAGAQLAHPYWAMFPIRSAHKVCKITVHDPIDSVGNTEEELIEAVRAKMIAGLPADQKP